MDSWHDAEVWAEFLPAHSPVTAAFCASAAAAAVDMENQLHMVVAWKFIFSTILRKWDRRVDHDPVLATCFREPRKSGPGCCSNLPNHSSMPPHYLSLPSPSRIWTGVLSAPFSVWRWCQNRSALFDSLRTASAGSLSKLLSAPSLHLVSLLKYGLDDLCHAWAAQATPPSWRLHQLTFPQHWNVRMPLNDLCWF